MVRFDPPAARYRIVIDRTADHLFVATCAELPDVSAGALGVEAAVDGVRAALAARLPALLASGTAPTPLCEVEGPLGEWTRGLELIDGATRAAKRDLQKPVPSALRAIAEWTTCRYRVVLEAQAGGVVANSPEMPEVVGQGATHAAAVTDLQRRLAERAYAVLDAGGTPPEPLQDVEARDGAGRNTARRRQAA